MDPGVVAFSPRRSKHCLMPKSKSAPPRSASAAITPPDDAVALLNVTPKSRNAATAPKWYGSMKPAASASICEIQSGPASLSSTPLCAPIPRNERALAPTTHHIRRSGCRSTRCLISVASHRDDPRCQSLSERFAQFRHRPGFAPPSWRFEFAVAWRVPSLLIKKTAGVSMRNDAAPRYKRGADQPAV